MALAVEGSYDDEIKSIDQLFLILPLELDPEPATLAGPVGTVSRLDDNPFGAIGESLAKVMFSDCYVGAHRIFRQPNETRLPDAMSQ